MAHLEMLCRTFNEQANSKFCNKREKHTIDKIEVGVSYKNQNRLNETTK